MKLRNSTSLAALVALALLASSTTALAQAGKPPASRSNVAVDVVATSTAEFSVFVTQVWDGEDAKRMRQSLDVYFGAADGTLTPSEIERISRAAETDLRSTPLTWLLLGGEPFTVTNASVSFGNATGAVKEFRPLSMVHDLRLSASSTSAALPLELRFHPQWNGTLSFAPPEGHHVSNVSGLSDPVSEEGTTRGGTVAGQAVTLLIAPGDPPTTTISAEDAGELPPSGSSAKMPAVLPLAIVGAAAAVGLVVVLVRRRRSER